MFGKKRESKDKVKEKDRESNSSSETNNAGQSNSLTKSLDENIALFRRIFFNDDTLVVRQFENKYLKSAKCCIIYFDSMVDLKIVNDSIIKPILDNNLNYEIYGKNLLEELQNKVIVSNSVSNETDMNIIINSALSGDTVFLLDGFDSALLICTRGWEKRSISEPNAEKVVRGPREGFTESIETNITLLRRRIKDPGLKLKFKYIGEKTHTKTCICYIEDIASKNILRELERRLNEIDIDGIIDSGYIQELIRDAPLSPFQTIGNTERPDIVAARLLEGRIALIVDGSPAVLTVPYVLVENTQVSEDYYNNYIFSSFNRLTRTAGAILSTVIPSLYLAVVTFHLEMIPTSLLLSISAARQGVPIPTALSLFIMLIIFDVLREAGTRMPSAIGQAVNIVGALVLGQAAVDAKLVSAPVVIITALSGILTFLNISMIGAVITTRLFILLATSVLGVYGFIFSFLLVIMHLMSIRSFGVPYMLGISKVKNHDGQDGWIRAPWWSMTLRPKIIGARNLVRQSGRKKRRK